MKEIIHGFTEQERLVLQVVIETTWNQVADDMFVDDEGKLDETITYSSSDVAEIALDAGRWKGRTDHDDVIVGDLVKKFYALEHSQQIKVLAQTLPYSVYGY